ncbi:GIY-YIG nuclease family protein [Paraburkholderia graminis]
MKHYLYQIKNKTNGKAYIGVTKDPVNRWRQHTQKTITVPTPVHTAIQIEGKDNFEFEVLCVGEKAYLKDVEEAAILALGTLEPYGYNKAIGLKKTPACRSRSSQALKGKQGRKGWESPRKGVPLTHATVTCPHCQKSGGGNVMSRWHFDNCTQATE